jgi:hypothetical protein
MQHKKIHTIEDLLRFDPHGNKPMEWLGTSIPNWREQLEGFSGSNVLPNFWPSSMGMTWMCHVWLMENKRKEAAEYADFFNHCHAIFGKNYGADLLSLAKNGNAAAIKEITPIVHPSFRPQPITIISQSSGTDTLSLTQAQIEALPTEVLAQIQKVLQKDTVDNDMSITAQKIEA